uniref:Coupling protein VirD4, ATPase required for T-DNA transfer n=1 Tax=Escherichia coli TaxID=562 RepID=A0A2K9UZL8_ECOLX|nr:Coupling protein VirD4, ATPase required for T-DNA transfer [Escherichia coli]
MCLFFIIWQLNKTDVALYGDAKFASDNDLRKSKLLKWEKRNTDILVGAYKGKYLWYTAPDFVSLGAGTRAGKGAAIGIPNLLVRKHSLIALDQNRNCGKSPVRYVKNCWVIRSIFLTLSTVKRISLTRFSILI